MTTPQSSPVVAPGLPVVAVIVETESSTMVWLAGDIHEARLYCDEDEEPIPCVLQSDASTRIAELTAELEAVKKDAERAERNRDMWKGQCERQAKRLEKTHAALRQIVSKERPSTKGISDSGQATDLSMMVMTLVEIAHAALNPTKDE